MHLQPTHHCIVLDSLLHSTVRPTASTSTIGAKVAAAFCGAAGSVLDDFMLLRERCRCCEVACEAAWSCQAPLKAAVAAHAQCTFVRAAWAVCPRVCGGSGDAIFAENAVRDSLCSAQKMESDRWSYFTLRVRLCVCHASL